MKHISEMMSACKELATLQPLSTDIKVMEKQGNQMNVTRFLSGLPPEYEPVRHRFVVAQCSVLCQRSLLDFRKHPLVVVPSVSDQPLRPFSVMVVILSAVVLLEVVEGV